MKEKGKTLKVIQIPRGFCQACLVLHLFNIDFEEIFNKALYDSSEGILVNRQQINNILQNKLTKVTQTKQNIDLNLNTKPTKYMIIVKHYWPIMLLHRSARFYFDR